MDFISVSPFHAEGTNSGYALILPLVGRKSQAKTQLNQSHLVATNSSLGGVRNPDACVDSSADLFPIIPSENRELNSSINRVSSHSNNHHQDIFHLLNIFSKF